MNRKSMILGAMGVLCCITFFQCSTPNGSSDVGDSGPFLMTLSGTYTIVGADSICEVLTIPGTKYCHGDTVGWTTDSTATVGVTYTLNGNEMRYLTVTETLSVSGAIIQRYTLLSRVGNGTGIVGRWRIVDPKEDKYTVLFGTPNAQEVAGLYDSSSHVFDNAIGILYVEYKSDGSLSFESMYDPSEMMLISWTSSYGGFITPACSSYAITATKVSSREFRMYGQKNNETITITWKSLSAMTYASSNPAHSSYSYDANSTTCPTTSMPSWYNDFMTANAKTTAKLGASESIMSKPESLQSFYNICRRIYQ